MVPPVVSPQNYVDVPVHVPDEQVGVVMGDGCADEEVAGNLSPGLIPQVDGCNDTSANKSFINYPSLLCTNARSIMPKIDCLCSTIEQEKVDITFVSELWLKTNNPLHSREIELGWSRVFLKLTGI